MSDNPEHTENYQTFYIMIEKQIRKVDKDDNKDIITISYEIKFIDSGRFMANLSSNLVHNLAEGMDKLKCKDFHCFLEYESARIVKWLNKMIKYKCLFCNSDYSNKIDKPLRNWFKNAFKVSSNGINKFICC